MKDKIYLTNKMRKEKRRSQFEIELREHESRLQLGLYLFNYFKK